MRGGGRDDELRGGAGNDVEFGDGNSLAGQVHGRDVLYGDAGDDQLVGGGSNDDLYGGDGNDQLDGDSGVLDGSWHGAYRMWGGIGADTIVGSGGVDYTAVAGDAARGGTFNLLTSMRSHIVWYSDSTALGGKIAYEYATKGNIDSVSISERFAILADANLNVSAQPITLVGVQAMQEEA